MPYTAALPSPASGTVDLGPLSLHAYGLCIAIGVLAAVWLASKRWIERGGTADDINAIALWGVPAGILGARLYHVVTDVQLYRDDPLSALAIWDGGLGIWGGIAAGVAAGLWVARRRQLAFGPLLDAVAPALALGQAIGRWGNYFNQELFGRPTSLPWGLEVELANRPIRYLDSNTFHPTFLYESLWSLGLVAALLLFDRYARPRVGMVFATYVAGYTFARFFIEGLRADPANELAGLRVNEWMSLFLFVLAIAWIVRERRRGTEAALPDEAMGPAQR